MECSPHISALVLVLLAVGTTCSVNSACVENRAETCSPGTFYNSKGCKCEECPEETFSSLSGARHNYCTRCKVCQGYFQVKVACSRRQDAQCECVTGYRCIGTDCSACAKNCGGAEEPAHEVCRKCLAGTFNNDTNGSCKPWTDCGTKRLVVLVDGTNTTDAVCGPPPAAEVTGRTFVDPGFIGGMVGFFLMCIVCSAVVMLAVSYIKKKLKDGFKQVPTQNVKTAEAEDACSYHLPEEEQGSDDSSLSTNSTVSTEP